MYLPFHSPPPYRKNNEHSVRTLSGPELCQTGVVSLARKHSISRGRASRQEGSLPAFLSAVLIPTPRQGWGILLSQVTGSDWPRDLIKARGQVRRLIQF